MIQQRDSEENFTEGKKWCHKNSARDKAYIYKTFSIWNEQ